MSWTSILPVAPKRRANKGNFTPLAIVLKARLLDNEKKESSSVETKTVQLQKLRSAIYEN
jgi:hypothetical protein